MRIGLLGGSFDPPHTGHLLAAGDAFEALALDRLVFIPAATNPLKIGRVAATPEDRLAMARLLVDGDPRFDVDPIEIERGGLSYMVDTLMALAARWPEAELYLLVGADVPQTFAQWRESSKIAGLASVVVMQRTGEAPNLASMPAGTRGLATRRIDISSTEVRERVAEGRSIRGFVPDAVAEYIAAKRLYS